MNSNALLSNWRTSIPMTILGIILGAVISCAGSYSVVTINSQTYTYSGSMTIGLIVQLIYVVASIIYAAVLYQSYFSDSPKATGAGAVSLLNGLFGGIIFGCLWNANLTKRNKGISWIVFIVLSVITAISVLKMLF